jgi:hypothetical protein
VQRDGSYSPQKTQNDCRAVIRVYDEAGNVIETHEHKGELSEP